jgi:hypothetical protein
MRSKQFLDCVESSASVRATEVLRQIKSGLKLVVQQLVLQEEFNKTRREMIRRIEARIFEALNTD